jgi:nucleoside-diphosphate-sugar epimerase
MMATSSSTSQTAHSQQASQQDWLISLDSPILVTGASGFIGSRVCEALLKRGFSNIRCLARPSSDAPRLQALSLKYPGHLEVIKGNLLSRQDCSRVMGGIFLVYHLAAGRGEKSFPDAFMNSVVATRNLLDACVASPTFKRIVSVSSFAVYTNRNKPKKNLLDESCPIEQRPHLRGDAYCFAKVKQDEIIAEYGRKHNLPFVLVRPGYVYGPGNKSLSARVGISTFGPFLHLGGSNLIPATHVDNCADAVIRAGLVKGVEGEVFNVVDDNLPTSRQFLRAYKANVRRFHSIYVPRPLALTFCWMWERYTERSQGQLPRAFNVARWHAEWKGSRYSNEKLKSRLGWSPVVSTRDGLADYFQSLRLKENA